MVRSVGKSLGIAHLLRAAPVGALGRRHAARRHRPRAGAPAQGPPARRADRLARCQAARRHARRAQAPPPRERLDLDLRDPRPGRGDVARRPHRRDERGRAAAGRHPDRGLSLSRQSLRRPVHRLAGDEHLRRPRCSEEGGAASIAVDSERFELPRELLGMLRAEEGRQRPLARRPARRRAGEPRRSSRATGRSRRTSSSPSAASTSSTSRSAARRCAPAPRPAIVGKAGRPASGRGSIRRRRTSSTPSRAPRSASGSATDMARIRLENLSKTFGQFTARRGPRSRRRRRRVLRPAGADRRRQDHDAAPDRRPRKADRRPHLHRRDRRQRLGPGRARRGAGAAAIFALSAPHRARQPQPSR